MSKRVDRRAGRRDATRRAGINIVGFTTVSLVRWLHVIFCMGHRVHRSVCLSLGQFCLQRKPLFQSQRGQRRTMKLKPGSEKPPKHSTRPSRGGYFDSTSYGATSAPCDLGRRNICYGKIFRTWRYSVDTRACRNLVAQRFRHVTRYSTQTLNNVR